MSIGSCQFSLLNTHTMPREEMQHNELWSSTVDLNSSAFFVPCRDLMLLICAIAIWLWSCIVKSLPGNSTGLFNRVLTFRIAKPKHILFPPSSVPVCIMPSTESSSWNPGHHPLLLIPVPNQLPGPAHFTFSPTNPYYLRSRCDLHTSNVDVHISILTSIPASKSISHHSKPLAPK